MEDETLKSLIAHVRRSSAGGASFTDAFEGLHGFVRTLAATIGAGSAIELGGGANPLPLSTVPEQWVNDVDPTQLARLSNKFEKAVFDLADPRRVPGDLYHRFDLVFSRSVIEHVDSFDGALETTGALLSSGGVACHFFPLAASVPLVLNRVAPFELTAPLVGRVNRLRGREYARFPAVYDLRRLDATLGERIRTVAGVTEAEVVPFWGHGYYDSVPALASLGQRVAERAARRVHLRSATYCNVMMRK